MLWQEAYGADGTGEEDPLPKMIGDEDPALLGPYVPTEIDTLEKVRLTPSCPVIALLSQAIWCCLRQGVKLPTLPFHGQALHFAGVGPSDRVLDLGSGDGRWCVAAVQQFGAQCAVGVEIDEWLVEESRRKAAQCGVAGTATFACADLTAKGMSAAALCPGGEAFTMVIVFLLPEAEQKFEGQLMRLYAAGARVLSIAFTLDRLQWLTLARTQGPMYLYCKSSPAEQSTGIVE